MLCSICCIHTCTYTYGLTRWRNDKESLPVQEMQETHVQSLGREDSLEKEIATCSSLLAWKIPWTEEPGRLQSRGSQIQTQLSTQQLHCPYPKNPDKAENGGGCTKGWTRDMNASQLSSLLLFPVVCRLLFTIALILKHILPTPQFLISGYLINYY